jgi:hypothetical protein
MPTYLERYLAGEHERVWAELLALGERVREGAVYADASAVARETMRRVRHNVETLIPRLEALGYEFGYRWLVEEPQRRFTDEEIAEIKRECPHFRPPQPDLRERLAELEARVGMLPLSLQAWYEEVGTVNFVGKAPQTWDYLGYQGFQGAAYKTFAREHPDHAVEEFRQFDKAHPEFRQGVAAEAIYLDPLVIEPIEHTLLQVEPSEDMHGKNRVPLAPDYNHKYFVSGGGPYEIFAPCLAIDAPLDGEWHDTTFVDYLRVCFRWGGFPGLQRAPHPPAADLAALTRDLLPI